MRHWLFLLYSYKLGEAVQNLEMCKCNLIAREDQLNHCNKLLNKYEETHINRYKLSNTKNTGIQIRRLGE